jgi:hypothetical protein
MKKINYKKKYQEYKKEKIRFEKKYEYEIKKEKEDHESRESWLKQQKEWKRSEEPNWFNIITTTFGYVFGLTFIILEDKWLGPSEHYWLQSTFNEVVKLIYSTSETVGFVFYGIILLYCFGSLLFAGGHFFGILYKYYKHIFSK